MPGTEARRSSLSRQAGEPRTASSMSASTLASSFSSALMRRAMLFLSRVRRPLLALALGADHLDDLPAARDEIGQQPRGLIGQRPRLGLGCLGEMGDHGGVDRIGLGALADRLGEGADLGRIDDDDRQPCGRQGRPPRPSRSLRWPPGRRCAGASGLSRCTSSSRPPALRSTDEHLSTGTHGDVQTIFGDVDTNDDAVHGDPSLPNRASR